MQREHQKRHQGTQNNTSRSVWMEKSWYLLVMTINKTTRIKFLTLNPNTTMKSKSSKTRSLTPTAPSLTSWDRVRSINELLPTLTKTMICMMCLTSHVRVMRLWPPRAGAPTSADSAISRQDPPRRAYVHPSEIGKRPCSNRIMNGCIMIRAAAMTSNVVYFD